MENQKKPYSPPKIEIHNEGSSAYNRFMALLEEEEKEYTSSQSPEDTSRNVSGLEV